MEPPHGAVDFHHLVGGTTGPQMIAVGIGRVNERIVETFADPFIDNRVTGVR